MEPDHLVWLGKKDLYQPDFRIPRLQNAENLPTPSSIEIGVFAPGGSLQRSMHNRKQSSGLVTPYQRHVVCPSSDRLLKGDHAPPKTAASSPLAPFMGISDPTTTQLKKLSRWVKHFQKKNPGTHRALSFDWKRAPKKKSAHHPCFLFLQDEPNM